MPEGLVSIPGRGTRSHMLQLRVHMPQEKIQVPQLKKDLTCCKEDQRSYILQLRPGTAK